MCSMHADELRAKTVRERDELRDENERLRALLAEAGRTLREHIEWVAPEYEMHRDLLDRIDAWGTDDGAHESAR